MLSEEDIHHLSSVCCLKVQKSLKEVSEDQKQQKGYEGVKSKVGILEGPKSFCIKLSHSLTHIEMP